MKALKLTYKILLAVAFSFLVIVIFNMMMSTTLDTYNNVIFVSFFPWALLTLFIGFGLCYVNKRLSDVLGFALLGVSLFMLHVVFISTNSFTIFAGVTTEVAVLTIIAAVILYVISEAKANKPAKTSDEDDKMKQLLKWKELQEKNIITEAEFEEKKKEILTKLVEE